MSRPRRARERAPEISPVAWALLNDEPVAECTEKFILECFPRGHLAISPDQPSLQDFWDQVGAEIVETWARERPGHRPRYWWRWAAPREPWMPDPESWIADPRPDPAVETEVDFLRRHGLLVEREAAGSGGGG